MKIFVLLGCVVALVFTNPIGKLTGDIQVKHGPIRPQLSFVASADGKSYYTDFTTGRNWRQASYFCSSIGMRLASITSQNQFISLNNAALTGNFQAGHWIAGRDSQDITQFSWDGTSMKLDGWYLPFRKWMDVDYLTCVMFYKTGPGNSYLSYLPCYNPEPRTLCEG